MPSPSSAAGACDGVVRVLAAEQHRRIGADAVHPRVGQHGTARGEQRGERRFAATARERAAAALSEAGELAHPRDDAMLEHRASRATSRTPRAIDSAPRSTIPSTRRPATDRRSDDRRSADERDDCDSAMHVGAKPRENVVDVAAFGGQRLVEARRETRRRVRRGHAAVAIARLREVLRGERDERASDGGVGVGFESAREWMELSRSETYSQTGRRSDVLPVTNERKIEHF